MVPRPLIMFITVLVWEHSALLTRCYNSFTLVNFVLYCVIFRWMEAYNRNASWRCCSDWWYGLEDGSSRWIFPTQKHLATLHLPPLCHRCQK